MALRALGTLGALRTLRTLRTLGALRALGTLETLGTLVALGTLETLAFRGFGIFLECFFDYLVIIQKVSLSLRFNK